MQKIDADKVTKREIKRVEPVAIDDAPDAPAPAPEIPRDHPKRERKQARAGIESLAGHAARKDPAPEKKERKVKPKAVVRVVDKILKKKKIGANNAYLVEWTDGVQSWEGTRTVKDTPQFKAFVKANK